MLYFNEDFSEDERAKLAPYFTNLDRPVFAVINLPETVKGALFARYSRYPGTLRRLFLEEFADELPENVRPWHHGEGRRAAELYERVFVGFGDDSIAQLGGAHLACEWVSNVLTKVLQRPRLGSYLEQSTRYIAYDRPLPRGGFRYYRDPLLGPQYAAAMDSLFQAYSSLIGPVRAWVEDCFPAQQGISREAHNRAVHAKTLDLLRGLLPASSLSHLGIFASGQTYEQLVLHLFAHPLPEARSYGEMILGELRSVIPSFLARVDRPDRGGEWLRHLRTRNLRAQQIVSRFGLAHPPEQTGPSVRLVTVRGSEDEALAALLYEQSTASEGDIREALSTVSHTERANLFAEAVGERANRRHKPSRGLEALSYRFEIVSDYGAFRDLQRHRLCTVQWQSLTPFLGAEVPPEIEAAGVADEYRNALDISRAEYERLFDEGQVDAAAYALCMAYRIRYVIDLNARAAMHLIELRSSPQGHTNYRVIAQEMHRLIQQHHPSVAAAIAHVDHTAERRLERIGSEIAFTEEHEEMVTELETTDDRLFALPNV